jgi:hypothetical protein
MLSTNSNVSNKNINTHINKSNPTKEFVRQDSRARTKRSTTHSSIGQIGAYYTHFANKELDL